LGYVLGYILDISQMYPGYIPDLSNIQDLYRITPMQKKMAQSHKIEISTPLFELNLKKLMRSGKSLKR
jgi:hypothetical protein